MCGDLWGSELGAQGIYSSKQSQPEKKPGKGTSALEDACVEDYSSCGDSEQIEVTEWPSKNMHMAGVTSRTM